MRCIATWGRPTSRHAVVLLQLRSTCTQCTDLQIRQFRKWRFGNWWAFISFLAKFVLRMHRNCYFRAFGQNSSTAVESGDADFHYGFWLSVGITTWPWSLTFVLEHLQCRPISCHVMYQILAKLNNPRLNYSDLNIENLGAVRHNRFHQKWMFTILRPRDP